jgi:hypothetical protein
MSTSPYFKIITSESYFKDRYIAEQAKSFSELRSAAASEWGREYLFACRVIRRESQRNILPVLSRFILPSGTQFSNEITNFLEGPSQAHLGLSEHRLVRNYGPSLGQVWAAMAMFTGPPDRRKADTVSSGDSDSDSESDSDDGGRTKRVRRNTLQEDYVDSSMLQVGSSSPLAEGSQGTSSLGYVDSESHCLVAHPEDETLRLISCVIRHILYFAPPQDSSQAHAVVEFRDAKTRLAVSTPILGRMVVATDDGGLCLRQQSGGAFKTLRNRVAILEAKRRFQCLENGKPIISDNCFAQMTCEALVARLADPHRELQNSRYTHI